MILTRAGIAGLAFILWAALTTFCGAAPPDGLNALWQVAILGAICFLHRVINPQLAAFFYCRVGWNGPIGRGEYRSARRLDRPVDHHHAVRLVYQPHSHGRGGGNSPDLAHCRTDVVVGLAAATGLHPLRHPRRGAGVDCGARGPVVETSILAHWRASAGQSGAIGARGIDSSDRHYGPEGSGTIWHETAGGISLLGNGFGAFGGVQHALQLDFTVPQHAHSDALELLWETGIIGFCLLLIFMRQLLGPLNASRLVLIVFVVEGCFGFPAYLPATLCLVGVAAGHAVRDRAMVRGLARSRRDLGYPRRARAPLRQGYVAAYHGRAGHADKPAVS